MDLDLSPAGSSLRNKQLSVNGVAAAPAVAFLRNQGSMGRTSSLTRMTSFNAVTSSSPIAMETHTDDGGYDHGLCNDQDRRVAQGSLALDSALELDTPSCRTAGIAAAPRSLSTPFAQVYNNPFYRRGADCAASTATDAYAIGDGDLSSNGDTTAERTAALLAELEGLRCENKRLRAQLSQAEGQLAASRRATTAGVSAVAADAYPAGGCVKKAAASCTKAIITLSPLGPTPLRPSPMGLLPDLLPELHYQVHSALTAAALHLAAPAGAAAARLSELVTQGLLPAATEAAAAAAGAVFGYASQALGLPGAATAAAGSVGVHEAAGLKPLRTCTHAAAAAAVSQPDSARLSSLAYMERGF